MFISIKKIWRFLCHFFQSRKVWAWPQQSEVLIYDAANSTILLEYLKPWNPEFLHVRREQINIRVLLKSLFRKGKMVDAYIDCFIEKVRPRLVVTTMDNSAIFYRISGRHPDIKTLFLQNGIRGYFGDIFEVFDKLGPDDFSTFFVDYMLVFGSTIGERYSQYIKGSISLTGAVKNNFVHKENSPQSGVIAFVGHFRCCPSRKYWMGGTFIPIESWQLDPDNLVIQCLMNYANEHNKRLIIIPASHSTRREFLIQEKNYFREFMGIEPEFYEPSKSYPSYLAVDSSEVVVSLDSTLGYESIARGTKTAIFSIRGTLLEVPAVLNYGWPADYPDEGPFWTNKPDPDIFIRILDYLFEVSDEQWKKDVESTNFSSIMEYDSGNTIFQSILEKELGPPPTSAH